MIDTRVTVAEMNSRSLLNMGMHLGIEFIESTSEYIKSRMPVDHRTRQPLGLLNGGASAALAEITGSMGAYLSVDRAKFYTLGLEIKCNHISGATDGYVYAVAKPLHVGRTTHVWQIEITNEQNELICFSTLTMAVREVDDAMREKFKHLFFKV